MSAALEIAGDRLRVRFVRQGDRFGHVIDAWHEGAFQSVLESVEGAAHDLWPPSPPWQELHLETRSGAGRVALLVGRAGRSHWSLSVHLEPESGAILCDAACRTSAVPRWLGSTYHMLCSPPEPQITDCGLGVSVELLQGVKQPLLAEDGALVLSAIVSGETGPQTVRWQYRIAK